MTPIGNTKGALPGDLPIPASELFYADEASNAQEISIRPCIDYVHFPTLGCPALVGPGQKLQVLLSLPADMDADKVTCRLHDRHNMAGGGSIELKRIGQPEKLAPGPQNKRKMVRQWLDMDSVRPALFDLHVDLDGLGETQYNSVRRYEAITGSEKAAFCGDSQYNVDNRKCLEAFIDMINERDDIAWICLIGDVCDNGVKGAWNLIRIGAGAEPGPVTNYYEKEYQKAHELLRSLRHPVFLVPGNHDGMSAYQDYAGGQPSDVFMGPDTVNKVEYDGLHYFRRTFGPPYYSFDWDRTRYICTNTFELTQQQRLGYHAIVANWGGWMREEQAKWVERELDGAGGKEMRKVMLMHHDPRGGSEGARLGYYHRMRRYDFNGVGPILRAYLWYALGNCFSTWQQEWMAHDDGDMSDHPVKELLRAILENEVWAVIMGHDNDNWIDSYFAGEDIFNKTPTHIVYAKREDVGDDLLVNGIMDCLKTCRYDTLLKVVGNTEPQKAETALNVVLAEIKESEGLSGMMFSGDPAKDWKLDVRSAIHFVHVDDVGAYKYADSDLNNYGFVLATLDKGAPVRVQGHRTGGEIGEIKILGAD